MKAFILNSLDCIAPYSVFNDQCGKLHYSWTYKGACEWLACYDAGVFGESFVMNFNGDIIAKKG